MGDASDEYGPSLREANVYDRIYALVACIPAGCVASYGQLAALEGRCGPRQVGFAMSHLPDDLDLPWHRVVNSAGAVSERSGGGGTADQRARLIAEGVLFNPRGRINLSRHAWPGPDFDWLDHHGFEPAPMPG